MRARWLLPLALAGCGKPVATYTLYRDSPIGADLRVHWASFDANERGVGSSDYTRENCEMTADLLRANLRRLNGGKEPVRFWCEKGSFHE